MNSSSLTVHQNDYEVSTASVVSESHRVSAWLLIDVNATLTCCDFCSMITYLSLSGSRHTFLSSLWGPLPSACWCSERCLQPFSHSVMVPTQPCLLPMLSTDGFSWEVPTATCELSCSLGALSKEKMSQLGKPGPGFLLSLPSGLTQDSLTLPATPCDDTGLFVWTREAPLNLVSRVFIADQFQRHAVPLTDAQRPAPESPFLSHNRHSPLVMFLRQIYLAKSVQPDLRPQAHGSSLNRQNPRQIQRFSAKSLPWASLDDTPYSVMCGACVTLPCPLLYPSLWLLSFHFLYLIAIEYLNFYIL